MQRRTFLGTLAVLGGGLLGWRLAAGHEPDAIVRVLRKRLSYLQLDPQGLDAFARDMVAKCSISKLRLRLINVVGPLYDSLRLPADSRWERMLRHGEDRIVTVYLMSSDFFVHGADKSRVVRYLGYYDPLVACNNPFACRPPAAGG